MADLGLYHKLHGEHRPIQMKKTVIKRRKRIIPTNYPPGTTPPHSSRPGGPPSNSSNSPSPPPNLLPRSPPMNNYGPLPPPWPSQPNLSTRTSQSYSPEPQDFTNYRPYACSPTFPSSYNEQNTLPPIRLPVGQNPQFLTSHQPPSIQHVGGAIPLPKRKIEEIDPNSKRLRSIGPLLNSGTGGPDPLEGARVLLSLGSRESVIRKRAELIGEIEILGEQLIKLKKAVAECDEFLGKA